jgi:hypothetical protein
MSRPQATQMVAAAELGVGAVLVTRGPRCCQMITRAAPARTASAATRALGVRYLVQGVSQLLWPNHLPRIWAGVDLLHAGTMALLALHHGPARRPALLSGSMAAVHGGYGWCRAHRS